MLHDSASTILRRVLFIGASLLVLMTLAHATTASDRSRDAEPPSSRSQVSGRDEFAQALAEAHGQVVLVHFWATWCVPCLYEIPSLVAFHDGPYRELARDGLAVLTVNNDLRREDLDRFLENSSLPFPIYFDSSSELNLQFHLWGLPGTLVIGRAGNVRGKLYGPQDWQSEELLARLTKYTRE